MAVRNPMEPIADDDPLTPVQQAAPLAEASGPLVSAELVLGHVFARPELLAEALTHRSAAHDRHVRSRSRKAPPKGTGSNERLEFIGDRVLGLVVAEWLAERFPDEQEGQLGPRHAQLVSRQVLAGIAEAVGLADALAVAPNEARAGVQGLATVLSDALEAVIGALYLDGGLEVARRFIRTAWAGWIDGQVAPPKDPKTGLQEWALGRGLKLPVYATEARSGPSHAPVFTITVTVPGLAKAAGTEDTGRGSAGSKREAERLAAQDLLARLTDTERNRT